MMVPPAVPHDAIAGLHEAGICNLIAMLVFILCVQNYSFTVQNAIARPQWQGQEASKARLLAFSRELDFPPAGLQ